MTEYSDAHTGTCNELNNYLSGNSANNELRGLAGYDYLSGNAGIDTLYAYDGKGNDIYRFFIGDGSDILSDFDTEGATDMIFFANADVKQTIAFFRDGSDLQIVYGDTDCFAAVIRCL